MGDICSEKGLRDVVAVLEIPRRGGQKGNSSGCEAQEACIRKDTVSEESGGWVGAGGGVRMRPMGQER